MTDQDQRDQHWRSWHNQVLANLAELARSTAMPPSFESNFLIHHYCANEPTVIDLPHWQLDAQKLEESEFIRKVRGMSAHDGYYYHHNNRENWAAIAPLFAEPLPLPVPPILQGDSSWSHLRIGGGGTMMPLHFDIGNILVVQMMGRKHLRLVRPSQLEKVEHIGRNTSIGWLDDATAAARGIVPKDFILSPGEALFLPIEWFHCVRALEPSITALLTSFVWPNEGGDGYPSNLRLIL